MKNLISLILSLICLFATHSELMADECPMPSYQGQVCLHRPKKYGEADAGQKGGAKKFCYEVRRYPGESPGDVAARVAASVIYHTLPSDREENAHDNRGPLIDAINMPEVEITSHGSDVPMRVNVGTRGECGEGGMYCICWSQLVMAITREIFEADPTAKGLGVGFNNFEGSAHAFGYYTLAEKAEYSCGGQEKVMLNYKEVCPASPPKGSICYFKCPPKAALTRRKDRLDRAERVYTMSQVEKMLKSESERSKLRGCIFLNANHGGVIEEINSHGNINTFEGNAPAVQLTAKKPAPRRFEGVGRGAIHLSEVEAVVCPFDYAANQVWTPGPSFATELSCVQQLDRFVGPSCKTCQDKKGNHTQ